MTDRHATGRIQKNDKGSLIHPTALVEPGARLAPGVAVGAYSIIGANVEIAEGSVIGPHVVIKGPSRIGRNNRFFQFSSIGEDCQDLKYNGEPTRLEIGDGNTFREGCTIHRGTVQDNSVTRIGSGNLIMAYVHIAHDCVIGDDVVMANNVSLAGHVHIGDSVIMGGYTLVHQFVRIAEYSLTAAGSVLFKDLPAFVTANGRPAKPVGMNYEGMRRRGYSSELINTLKSCYKIVYRSGLKVDEAIERMQVYADSKEVQLLIRSIQSSTRGIVR